MIFSKNNSIWQLLLLCALLLQQAALPQQRGRLANPGFVGQPVKTSLFFAGQARDGVQFYECNPGNNLFLYTDHPADNRHLQWSVSTGNRQFALDEMVAAGLNTISMSYWGERFLPCSSGWNSGAAPMQTSTYAHDELFAAVQNKSILIIPFIEGRGDWTFRGEFPGSSGNPAPGTVSQICELINRYLQNPSHPEWATAWAQVFDRNGTKRYAVTIIHAASDLVSTDAAFAAGFDMMANKVYVNTGIHVGFFIDALPRGTYAPGNFKPDPASTGPALLASNSLLGIQCFIPEVWLGSSNENNVKTWKRSFSQNWHNSGVPFLQDVSPGYDAHIVFPGSVKYGFTTTWRSSLAQMVEDFGSAGLVYNSWNGYTEGMSALASTEYGSAHNDWLRSLAGTYQQSLRVKIILEGAYDTKNHAMKTTLRDHAFIPCQSPHPLDPRHVDAVPDGVCDWILLRLRKTIAGSDLFCRSYFLGPDGHLLEDDLSQDLSICIADGNYYLLLSHRNHIMACSARPLTFAQGTLLEYDFSTSQADCLYPERMIAVENGIWGVRGGDINHNEVFDSTDLSVWLHQARAAASGYNETDLNLDGEVTTKDFRILYNNIESNR